MTYIYQQAKVVPHTAKKEEVAHQKKTYNVHNLTKQAPHVYSRPQQLLQPPVPATTTVQKI